MRVEQFVMAHGVSIGKIPPAYPEEVQTVYPRQDCTAQNAAAIPCRQVLGAYMVALGQKLSHPSEPVIFHPLASEQGAFLRAEYRICELVLVFLLCFYKI